MNRFQKQRRNANLLLGSLAVCFVACIPMRDEPGLWRWAFYVIEAALAAACADWFAVTALFQHPLGLPIPHTAIIPRKHADIGIGVVSLIREQFLPLELLRKRIELLSPTRIMLRQAHRSSPSDLANLMTSWLARIEDTAPFAAQLDVTMAGALRETKVAGLLGALLEQQLRRNRVDPAFDLLLGYLDEVLGSEECSLELERQLGALKREQIDHLDWWQKQLLELADSVGALDEADAARDTVKAARKEFAKAINDRNHELRAALGTWTEKLAIDLGSDTDLAKAVDEWWAELVETMDLRKPIEDLLQHLLSPESLAALQPALSDGIAHSLRALEDDAGLADRLDIRARRLLHESLPMVYDLLGPFVQYVFAERLTGQDLVRFIEDEVGDVLQQLRVTGTVVGGLVGLLLAVLIHVLG